MSDRAVTSVVDRSRSSYDLVLGSAFGAYVGITVSRDGLGGSDSISFGLFLLYACGFVLGLNNALQMVQRGNWTMTGIWSAIFGISFVLLFFKSLDFGLNLDVLAAIGAVWVAVAFCDAAINLLARQLGAKKTSVEEIENDDD